MSKTCPFCKPYHDRVIAETELTLTERDRFPVSPGHTLVIPKRHVGTIFEVTREELGELWDALNQAKQEIDAEFNPDSYNIGINGGPAAGQSVPHLHIHLIPRYEGDVENPRGGVRWGIPEKADYWSQR